jgi:hypothetical protein
MIELVVVHLLLAVILFFLMNWMGGMPVVHSHYYHISYFSRYETAPAFNVVFRALTPVVYIIIVAATMYAIGLDEFVRQIWLVALFQIVLVRWGFNVLYGRHLLLSWGTQVPVALVSVGLAYVAYRQILVDRNRLLPDPSTLANELWIAVALFLYKAIDQKARGSDDNTRLQHRYFRRRFIALRKRFANVVDEEVQDRALQPFVYAILVYETFNRPAVIQWLERHVFFPLGRARSLGPMQVRVSEAIDDAQIVRLGCRKIVADYAECYKATVAEYRKPDSTYRYPDTFLHDQALRCTAEKFNIRSDYPAEVIAISEFLQAEYFGGAPVAAVESL